MQRQRRRVDVGLIPRAASFWARCRGLLGRDRDAIGDGLFFPRCRSVHTAGMQVPIDVLFLDRDQRVLSVRHGLSPWRLAAGDPGTFGTLELPEGRAAELAIEPGCEVTWRDI